MAFHRVKNALVRPIAKAKAITLEPYLRPHFRAGQSWLDVGCGDGILTRHVMNTCPKTSFVGLDVIDYRMADIPMTVYDGLKFPFGDQSFDGAYAVTCLHHCDDEYAVLKEMLRVSRKRVLIVEEVYSSAFERLYLSLYDWIGNRLELSSMNVPFHFHAESEWRAMIVSTGNRIDNSEAVPSYPFWLRSLLLTFTRRRLFVIEKDARRS